MFPDLSYILHAIIGTNPDNGFSIIKTFGLFLALSFVVSAWFLSLELKRKEADGSLQKIKILQNSARFSLLDLLINATIGFIIGWKAFYLFSHFKEFTNNAEAVLLSSQGSVLGGILIAAGVVAYQIYTNRGNFKKEAEPIEIWVSPNQKLGDITMMAAVCGIAGAKIFALFEDPAALFQDPLGQLLSGSGLAIYGGLIGGFLGVYFYVKKIGIPPIHMMDSVAISLIMGYAVGRIGCQLSGDGDWGIVNTQPKPSWFILPDWMWSQSYPHNVVNEGATIANCTWKYCTALTPPVFPTPLYETILGFIIAAILWSLRKRLTIPGMLFCVYLILNGFERFWIEKIRVNPKFDLGFVQWSQAEIIAVLFFCLGIIGLFYLWKNDKQKHYIKTTPTA